VKKPKIPGLYEPPSHTIILPGNTAIDHPTDDTEEEDEGKPNQDPAQKQPSAEKHTAKEPAA